jgi:hypothetical protein
MALAQQGLIFAGTELDETAIETQLRAGVPRRTRSVGTSSVTFQVKMGDIDGAFKPRSRTHQRGYLAEVAAYRLARRLRLDTVPPAVMRTFQMWRLQEPFEGEEGEWEPLQTEMIWDNGSSSRGALIFWIPRRTHTDLDTPAGQLRWSAWLSIDGEVPEESRVLARDLSNMVVFDYLIANWDRFSGGNLATDALGQRLYVHDHNLCFTNVSGARYERVRDELMRSQRFSRSTLEQVMALDEQSLREALEPGEDGPEPLLDDRQIADVMSRRDSLISYVSALVELHGEERVLYFD